MRTITSLCLIIPIWWQFRNAEGLISELFCKKNPNIDKNFIEYAEAFGWKAESFTVKTEDSYIVTLYRLREKGKHNTPVLLVHGVMESAFDFLVLGEESLAIQLASAGFDVWIINYRGSYPSQGHETYTTKDDAYWEFSVHEVGIYDLTACIDFILKETRASKLNYIGYSLGAGVLHIMTSHKPEYIDKIEHVIILGSGVYISNTKSPYFRLIALYMALIGEDIASGEYRSDRGSPVWNAITSTCAAILIKIPYCNHIFYFLNGQGQWDPCMAPVFFKNVPAGTSQRLIAHVAQLTRTGVFAPYNYGKAKNMEKYGSKTPEPYDLSTYNINTTVFYSKGDIVVVPEDVDNYVKQLNPDLVDLILVEDDEFTHLDFVWGMKTKDIVYKKVISILNEYIVEAE